MKRTRRSRAREGQPQARTTSSMMGSGLAASSCSLTFSSTRWRKTTTEACRKGADTLQACRLQPLRTAAQEIGGVQGQGGGEEGRRRVPRQIPGFQAFPNQPEMKTVQRRLQREGLGFPG